MLWAPLEIAEQAKSYLDRLPEVKGIYPLSAVLKNAEPFARLELSQFDQGVDRAWSRRRRSRTSACRSVAAEIRNRSEEGDQELAELAETHQSRSSATTPARRSGLASCSTCTARACGRRSKSRSDICIGDSCGMSRDRVRRSGFGNAEASLHPP